MATSSRTTTHQLLPPADLVGAIERLQDDLDAERDRHLRTMADFKNYRRRIERDGNAIADERIRKIMLPLLDIVDDLEQALRWGGDEQQPVVRGVGITHKKLLALLATHGVLPFDSVGAPFDHHRHHAVAVGNEEGQTAGIVIDELRRGYLWNDELLRPAQVRVAG